VSNTPPLTTPMYKGRCVHCGPHVDRYVSSGGCVKCARRRSQERTARDGLEGHTKANANARLLYHYSADPKRNWLRSAWKSARTNAKKRSLEFVRHIVPTPDHCPVLGLALDYSRKGEAKPNSASLDRIESGKGYVPSNVRVISWRANDLKSNGTAEEFALVLQDLLRLRDARVEPTTILFPTRQELAQARHDARARAGVRCPYTCSRCPKEVRQAHRREVRAAKEARSRARSVCLPLSYDGQRANG
jgi:hypothetical protein